MGMFKAVIICALLHTLALQAALADEILELQLENPVTLLSSDGLYTIWKTNSSIHLNSTKQGSKPCTIAIDPVKDFTLTKIQAKELANKKFIIWAYRSFDHNHKTVSLNYTALLVDPSSCSYKSVPIIEEKTSQSFWPTFHTGVVPFKDGFDFFYTGYGKCLPCRFSLEGKPIPLGYQLEPEKEPFVPYGFNIQVLDEADLSKGYIYMLNYKNNTAVIKHLDSKFKVTKQLLLEHPLHSLSVNYGEKPIISICYASHNFVEYIRNTDFKVQCEQFDSDLKSKLTVRLAVPGDQFVFGLTGITHQVDSVGNMFVGVIQNSRKLSTTPTRQLRFFASDNTGKVVETRDYEKSNMQSQSEYFELRSYLYNEKKFCIVTDILAEISKTEAHETITCIDVTKYVK